MAGFGRAGGGGRRSACRQKASQEASLSTVSRTYYGKLVDVSAIGARIRGAPLPPAGQDAWLRIGPLKLFGEVRWASDTECGVEFIEPLRQYELSMALASRGR